MQDDIRLTFATPSDLIHIKGLMLNALKNDTQAFSVSYKDYSEKSEDWWQNYCFSFLYSIKGRMILAWDKDKAVGMVGVLYSPQERRFHVASIVWMFIEKEYRGKHIAKRLLDKLEDEIKKQKAIRKIILSVTSTQQNAIKLYEKNNFKIVGKLTQEFDINGEFIDEIVMEKIL